MKINYNLLQHRTVKAGLDQLVFGDSSKIHISHQCYHVQLVVWWRRRDR